jgi:type IV pilus assembly protein PilE
MLEVMAQGQATRASGLAARGFTLIELMITVAIVGVLAVCAYAGYHKFVTSSHQTEANNVLTGIAGRQDSYKAATGNYMPVSLQLGSGNPLNLSPLYPHCKVAGTPAPGSYSVEWPTRPCGACCTPNQDWLKLGVQVTSPTYYGYSTIAGVAGAGLPGSASSLVMNGNSAMFATASTVQAWYIATAVGDTDGNGLFTTSMISSFDNQIHIDADGE